MMAADAITAAEARPQGEPLGATRIVRIRCAVAEGQAGTVLRQAQGKQAQETRAGRATLGAEHLAVAAARRVLAAQHLAAVAAEHLAAAAGMTLAPRTNSL